MTVVSTAAQTPLPPLSIRAWLRYDVVSRALAGLGPESVLEIGCGQGALGARLAGTSAYTGVEPDAASYATAAARIEPRGGRVLHGTDADLPDGETFDAVCAFEVLEHIDDDRAALARWASHLRPGGHLVLSVPAFQERFGPMDAFAGHYRRYEPEILKERLAEAGLSTRQLTVYAWPLGYALESVRNRIDERKLAAARAEGTPIEDLSAASGRTFQPGGVWKGRAVQAAVLPFRALQRLQPGRGIGMVVVAQS
jgi:SAM-dependent methyltransferase